MNKDKVLQEIIKGYRNTISTRYQYQTINDKFDLPASVTEETVNQLRHYFLNYIYPENNTREELNDSFKSLDDYIKHPQKLLKISIDAAKLVFKYGRHLPKILIAALNAMKTFKAATEFENNLVQEAIKHEIKPPYDNKKIDELIKFLSRKKIDEFIDISQSLFDILHDRKLVAKIKEVIYYLIKTMKSKPASYSSTQIKGLEIGLEMIIEGDKLFTQLSKEDQGNFVHLITTIERDNLDRIFNR